MNGGSEEGGVIQGRNVKSGRGKSGSRQGRVESVISINTGSVKVIIDDDVSSCSGIKKSGTV